MLHDVQRKHLIFLCYNAQADWITACVHSEHRHAGQEQQAQQYLQSDHIQIHCSEERYGNLKPNVISIYYYLAELEPTIQLRIRKLRSI